MNLLRGARHPSQRSPPPVEAYRKPEPVPLWLMFRLMHLQDYLFWSCHLFVIAAAGLLRLEHGLGALFQHKVIVRNIWLCLKRNQIIKLRNTFTAALYDRSACRFLCCCSLIQPCLFSIRGKFSYMPVVPDKFYCLNADWIHLFSLKDWTFEQTVGIFAITFIWECPLLCTLKSNFGQ